MKPPAAAGIAPMPLPSSIAPKIKMQVQWDEQPLVLVRAQQENSTKLMPKSDVFRATAAPFLDAQTAAKLAMDMSMKSGQSLSPKPIGFTADLNAPRKVIQGAPQTTPAEMQATAQAIQKSSAKFVPIKGATDLDSAIAETAKMAGKRYQGGSGSSFAVLEDKGKYFASLLQNNDNETFMITPGKAGNGAEVTLEFLNPSVKAVVDAYSMVRAPGAHSAVPDNHESWAATGSGLLVPPSA